MNILKIQEVEKHDEHALVFPAVSLTISSGDIIAIHSSTNARSALFDMFIGKAPLSNGEITLYDQAGKSLPRAQLHQHIGFFLLEDGLYERLSVKDHFSFYMKLYGSTLSIDDVLRIVQLETKGNKRVDTLSQSEKRRVHFGRLLFQNHALYIFEEPDQNMDLETKRVFMKIMIELTSKGKAVLILTGNMESAITITDHVYRLNDTGLHPLDVVPEEDTSVEIENVTSPKGQSNEEGTVQPVRFEKIPTKVNEKIVLFDPPEIDYIESSEGKSNLYIKGEKYPCIFTMTELEDRLHPYGFFRCHRSYIVNLQKVREVVTWTRNSFTLILTDANKSSIPLSKTKMAELKEMLGLK